MLLTVCWNLFAKHIIVSETFEIKKMVLCEV